LQVTADLLKVYRALVNTLFFLTKALDLCTTADGCHTTRKRLENFNQMQAAHVQGTATILVL
jgi:hypothetical protein